MREHISSQLLILNGLHSPPDFFNYVGVVQQGWGAFVIDGTAMPLGTMGPGIITVETLP